VKGPGLVILRDSQPSACSPKGNPILHLVNSDGVSRFISDEVGGLTRRQIKMNIRSNTMLYGALDVAPCASQTRHERRRYQCRSYTS
jgi:hypothetical protein